MSSASPDINPAAPTAAQFRSRIGPLHGAPALFVNDRPIFLNTPFVGPRSSETFAPARPEVYALHHGPFAVRPGGEVDIEPARGAVEAALRQWPDALVIVRTFPPAPAWWLDAHPDECLGFDLDVRRYRGYEHYRDASWASDLWLRDVCGWYESFSCQLHRLFGGRVIGHQWGGGSNGENGPIGTPTQDERWFCGDFSPAMHRYFRAWLREKYGSDAALREAWSDADVTLKTAAVPGRLERLRTDWLTFRDPRKRQVSDYYQAHAESIQRAVIEICRAIKRGTNNEVIAGSHLGAMLDNGFHGYLYHQTLVNMVHDAMAEPAVDTFTSPASYENRDPGGDANSMMVLGSLALHGKLVYQDQDTRTSVLPEGYREAYTLGKIAADIPETIGVLKRDAAHAVIHGYGLWWHAMVPGMYDHPAISECLGRLADIGRRSLRFPRGTPPGVAMVVDEESNYYQACANRLMYPMLYHQRQFFWSRSGVPWKVYLHNDLSHPAMADHRVYYFLNTFFLTDEEVEAIRRKVCRPGTVVVWTYAPALQSPRGLSLERVERLTGFRLKAASVEAVPRVSYTHFDHPFVRYGGPIDADAYASGGRQPMAIGTGPLGNDERGRAMGPLIYVNDPEATVLGELDALQQPGLAVKRVDGWTSVFCSSPMIDHYLLRNIAREAGVHVYAESDDVVLPGRSFLMLHARRPGRRRVRLPAPADVYECYDGRLLGRSVSEFEDTLDRHATGLYFLGDADAYRA